MIQRALFSEILCHLKAKEISLIVGPRQVGKTTLMEELKREIIRSGARSLWLNLDFETDRIFFESQSQFLKKLKLEFGSGKGVVFIDEIQRKENAGLFLKGLYDMNLPYKFIVSGSGSLELKEKIHESLIGRKRLFSLSPVGFSEFLDFKTEYRYSTRLNEYCTTHSQEVLSFLMEYLNFGGYPRIILENELSEKSKLMNEIYRSHLDRDISALLKVERVDAFIRMIQLLSSQTGRILNHSELSKMVGVSVNTLKNYLWYAEKTFIVHIVTPYFGNRGKELQKSPVAYFYDLGLRNFSINLFGVLQQPVQSGFPFQNFIANRLIEKCADTGHTVHFWRTSDQAEVDFVINTGAEVLPIEVKFSSLKKPQVTRSLRSFLKRYEPAEAWVVNLSLNEEITIGTTRVRFIPYYQV